MTFLLFHMFTRITFYFSQMASDARSCVGLIAVHGGAGYHSPANAELYKQICKDACRRAADQLRQNKTALEAVTAAMVSLEDSPWTNAGMGSNLTVDGAVECDASIMDGDSLQYGAVGAVTGVKNPILVADNLLRTQQLGNMALGRVPPSTLVGDGANDWARKRNIQIVDDDGLVTDSARRAYLKHKRKLDLIEEGCRSDNKRSRLKHKSNEQNGESSHNRSDVLQDTVGAVCVDRNGLVASAVSSGGIVLKQPGRLGQAAMYGCGCWAENDRDGNMGVGVSTSGCGEHLTKTILARECGQCLKTQSDPIRAMSDTFHLKFLESPFIKTVDQKLGGALAVKVDSGDKSRMEVEVLWAHTTDSMCLGYMSTQDHSPKAFISRLPEGKRCGKSYVVQSKNLTIGNNCDVPINNHV